MSIRQIVVDARRGHRGLFWFAMAMAATAAVLVLLAIVDQRTLLGQPLWFKPLKFALSLTLYATTLAWMVSLLPTPGRLVRAAAWTVVATSVLEMVIIVGQAARGQRSHFNLGTPFDSVLYSIMGAAVSVLWLATAVIAVKVLRVRGLDPTVTTGIRAGLVIGLAGAALGVNLVLNDGHSVGVPDGGPGMWLTGWSTTGGDLRIGHFIGMHALQLLPLLAVLVNSTAGRLLDERARVAVVRIAATSYAAAVVLVTWQAYREQPLTSPDGFTVSAWAALVIATGVALLTAFRASERRNNEQDRADQVAANTESS